MKFKIVSFLFLTISLFSDPIPYYFINVPYGTSFSEALQNRNIPIPSFSRIEILKEEENQNKNFLPYDTGKKIKYKGFIGYVPKSYIGTYNIIQKKESPDKSKYFEIISPYKECNCNRYEGYIDSCFLEITSAKTNSLIKRIGNDKLKTCESHFWSRVKNWFNEEELLAPAHGDGDAGTGGSWGFAFEKINYQTGKVVTLYRVNQLNCRNSAVKDGYSVLYQINSNNKFYINWNEKLFTVSTPIIKPIAGQFQYEEKYDCFDCKLDFKKMKPINSESVIIYKEAKNQISYDIYGTFRYYYNGKEISEN